MKCGGKPKLQGGGSEFKIDLSYMNNAPSDEEMLDAPDMSYQQPQYANTIEEGIAKGIIEAPEGRDAMEYYKSVSSHKPKEKKDKFDPYWLYRGFKNGMSWLSGMVERGRQNRYDWMQQTALGQMNPMPTDDFQPTPMNMYAQEGGLINPYLTYMKSGGNLKTIIKDYNKFSNDAQMDMGDGKVDDQGLMQRGGTWNISDEYVKSMIRRLLMGRMGTNKYRGMKKGGIHIKKENRGKFTESAKRAGMGVQEFAKHVLANKDKYSSTQVKRANFARNAKSWRGKGGLTPNKAREILHDKKVHGKPLTDKQRRYFGAMSKGHTNYK